MWAATDLGHAQIGEGGALGEVLSHHGRERAITGSHGKATGWCGEKIVTKMVWMVALLHVGER